MQRFVALAARSPKLACQLPCANVKLVLLARPFRYALDIWTAPKFMQYGGEIEKPNEPPVVATLRGCQLTLDPNVWYQVLSV